MESESEDAIEAAVADVLAQAEQLPYNRRTSVAALRAVQLRDSPDLPRFVARLTATNQQPACGVQDRTGKHKVIASSQECHVSASYLSQHLGLTAAAASGRIEALEAVLESPSLRFLPLASKEYVRHVADDDSLKNRILSVPRPTQKLLILACVKQRRVGVVDWFVERALEKKDASSAAAILHGCSADVVERHFNALHDVSGLRREKIAFFHGESILRLFRAELETVGSYEGGTEKEKAENSNSQAHKAEKGIRTVSHVWEKWHTVCDWKRLLDRKDAKLRCKELLAICKNFTPTRNFRTNEEIFSFCPLFSNAETEQVIEIPFLPRCVSDNLSELLFHAGEECFAILENLGLLKSLGGVIYLLPNGFWSQMMRPEKKYEVQFESMLVLATSLLGTLTEEGFCAAAMLRRFSLPFFVDLWGSWDFSMFSKYQRKMLAKWCRVLLDIAMKIKPTKASFNSALDRCGFGSNERKHKASKVQDVWDHFASFLIRIGLKCLRLGEVNDVLLEPLKLDFSDVPSKLLNMILEESDAVWPWLLDFAVDYFTQEGTAFLSSTELLENEKELVEKERLKKLSRLWALNSDRKDLIFLSFFRKKQLWERMKVFVQINSQELGTGICLILSKNWMKSLKKSAVNNDDISFDLLSTWWNACALPSFSKRISLTDSERDSWSTILGNSSPESRLSVFESLNSIQLNALLIMWGGEGLPGAYPPSLHTILRLLPLDGRVELIRKLLNCPSIQTNVRDDLECLLDIRDSQTRIEIEREATSPDIESRKRGYRVMISLTIETNSTKEVLKTLQWLTEKAQSSRPEIQGYIVDELLKKSEELFHICCPLEERKPTEEVPSPLPYLEHNSDMGVTKKSKRLKSKLQEKIEKSLKERGLLRKEEGEAIATAFKIIWEQLFADVLSCPSIPKETPLSLSYSFPSSTARIYKMEEFGRQIIGHLIKLFRKDKLFEGATKIWWILGATLQYQISVHLKGNQETEKNFNFFPSFEVDKKAPSLQTCATVADAFWTTYKVLFPNVSFRDLSGCIKNLILFCGKNWKSVPFVLEVLTSVAEDWRKSCVLDDKGVLITPKHEGEREEGIEVGGETAMDQIGYRAFCCLSSVLTDSSLSTNWKEGPEVMTQFLESLLRSDRASDFVFRWWRWQLSRGGKGLAARRRAKIKAAEELISLSPSAIYLRCVWTTLLCYDQTKLSRFLSSSDPMLGVFFPSSDLCAGWQTFDKNRRRPKQMFLSYGKSPSPSALSAYPVPAVRNLYRLTPSQSTNLGLQLKKLVGDENIPMPKRILAAKRLSRLPTFDITGMVAIFVELGNAIKLEEMTSLEEEGFPEKGKYVKSFLTDESDFQIGDPMSVSDTAMSDWEEVGQKEELGVEGVEGVEEMEGVEGGEAKPSGEMNLSLEHLDINPSEGEKDISGSNVGLEGLIPGLPGAILTTLLNSLTRIDEPLSAITFVIAPSFLESHGQLSLTVLRHVKFFLPREDDFYDILFKLCRGDRRKVMKMTPLKDVIRLLALSGSERCLQLLLREHKRPGLHRDIHTTIVQSFVQILGTPEGKNLEGFLLPSLNVATFPPKARRSPEYLLPYLSVFPKDSVVLREGNQSFQITPFKSKGPKKLQKLVSQLQELPIILLPSEYCDYYFCNVVLPVCRNSFWELVSSKKDVKEVAEEQWAGKVLFRACLMPWIYIKSGISRESREMILPILVEELTDLSAQSSLGFNISDSTIWANNHLWNLLRVYLVDFPALGHETEYQSPSPSPASLLETSPWRAFEKVISTLCLATENANRNIRTEAYTKLKHFVTRFTRNPSTPHHRQNYFQMLSENKSLLKLAEIEYTTLCTLLLPVESILPQEVYSAKLCFLEQEGRYLSYCPSPLSRSDFQTDWECDPSKDFYWSDLEPVFRPHVRALFKNRIAECHLSRFPLDFVRGKQWYKEQYEEMRVSSMEKSSTDCYHWQLLKLNVVVEGEIKAHLIEEIVNATGLASTILTRGDLPLTSELCAQVAKALKKGLIFEEEGEKLVLQHTAGAWIRDCVEESKKPNDQVLIPKKVLGVLAEALLREEEDSTNLSDWLREECSPDIFLAYINAVLDETVAGFSSIGVTDETEKMFNKKMEQVVRLLRQIQGKEENRVGGSSISGQGGNERPVKEKDFGTVLVGTLMGAINRLKGESVGRRGEENRIVPSYFSFFTFQETVFGCLNAFPEIFGPDFAIPEARIVFMEALLLSLKMSETESFSFSLSARNVGGRITESLDKAIYLVSKTAKEAIESERNRFVSSVVWIISAFINASDLVSENLEIGTNEWRERRSRRQVALDLLQENGPKFVSPGNTTLEWPSEFVKLLEVLENLEEDPWLARKARFFLIDEPCTKDE